MKIFDMIYVIVFILAAYFVICFVGAIVYFYRCQTGRISKEEQERLLEIYRREKEGEQQKRAKKKAKCRFGSSGFHSYPPPLNRWYWWH